MATLPNRDQVLRPDRYKAFGSGTLPSSFTFIGSPVVAQPDFLKPQRPFINSILNRSVIANPMMLSVGCKTIQDLRTRDVRLGGMSSFRYYGLRAPVGNQRGDSPNGLCSQQNIHPTNTPLLVKRHGYFSDISTGLGTPKP